MFKMSWRNAPPTGPLRDAYEELRDWAIDSLFPKVKRELIQQVNAISKKHGVSNRELLALIHKSPAGETRPEMFRFLYDVFFY